jgi:hypothetical protein
MLFQLRRNSIHAPLNAFNRSMILKLRGRLLARFGHQIGLEKEPAWLRRGLAAGECSEPVACMGFSWPSERILVQLM